MDDFDARFPDEEACLQHLISTRWPDGLRCLRCGSLRCSRVNGRNTFRCLECRRQMAYTSGTIFENHKRPLRTWFRAVHLIATIKGGIAALELHRQLGVSPPSAWTIHRKISHALAQAERTTELSGLIEAGECFIGPRTRGASPRGTRKAVVGVAVESRGLGRDGRPRSGSVTLEQLDSAASVHLGPWLRKRTAASSVLVTDGHGACPAATRPAGHEHRPEVEGRPDRGPEVLSRAHIMISNLTRVISGAHRGVSEKHLRSYLGGFAFRFNRRGRMRWIVTEALEAMLSCSAPTRRRLLCATG